ncbi:TetR/AcrR family transcriptional regulator C-terminal domain-containing protein [Sphaerisporangium sp. NPDC049002]|uniref:TetR/AcrR family transcriptional regulator C-terminal domain-containing protein n=1 Tax=Sphaerisporangium sp. NPDC049002 TaxID=3155392 RepID=UPI0033C11176
MPSKTGFTSVWSREAPAKRTREQPSLSREQIVRAAMELLDTEGMDALSMRKLGARLGSGATSIYWHVANKEELLELVLDEVYGQARIPDPAVTGWRDAAAAFAYGLRSAILEHPWSVTLIGAMPSLGPNALAVGTTLMNAFELAGFTGMTLEYASASLLSYTLGATMPEVSWLNTVGRSSADAEEWMKAIRPQMRVAAADYPKLLARYEDYERIDFSRARHLAFDFGLISILDGLEARLRQT